MAVGGEYERLTGSMLRIPERNLEIECLAVPFCSDEVKELFQSGVPRALRLHLLAVDALFKALHLDLTPAVK